ncbi:hypothetical protein PYCC9005_004458 [Savitreella phatthalungensis]
MSATATTSVAEVAAAAAAAAKATATCTAAAASASQHLAYVLWVEYALIAVVALAWHVCVRLWEEHVHAENELAGGRLARTSPWILAIRRRWLMPLFGGRRARPLSFGHFFLATVPTGAQTIALLALLLANLPLLFTAHCTMSRKTTAHSVAIRTGILAFANLPLAFGLGGRNDIITRVTGVSRETLMCVHKGAGRLLVALSVVHTCAYVYVLTVLSPVASHESKLAAFKALAHHPYFRAGAVAVAVGITLVLLAARALRDAHHEVFLWIHTALALTFTIASLLHERFATNAMGTIIWTYLALGLFGLDYFSRVLRLVVNNLGSLAWSKGERSACTFATLSAVGEDLVQVDVRLPAGRTIEPGTACYLSFPSLRFLSHAHPFTAMQVGTSFSESETQTPHNIGSSDDKKLPVTISVRGLGDRNDPGRASGSTISSLASTAISAFDDDYVDVEKQLACSLTPAPDTNVATFLVAVRCGAMTKALATHARNSPTTPIRCLIDGGYRFSPKPPVASRRFGSIVLLAGGVGITTVLPAFAAAAVPAGSSSQAILTQGLSGKKSIELIWVVRSLEIATVGIVARLREVLTVQGYGIPAADIRATVYVTGHAQTTFHQQEVARGRLASLYAAAVTVRFQRPSIPNVLDAALASATHPATTALVTCAGPSLCDDARAWAATAHAGHAVHYHEECY